MDKALRTAILVILSVASCHAQILTQVMRKSFTAPPSGSITKAQTNSCASATSPNTCAFTSNVTAGNVIVVEIDGSGTTSTPTPTISDSLGNFWMKGNDNAGSSFQRTTVYFVQSIATSGADTVTVSMTGTLYHLNVYMTEYGNASGIDNYTSNTTSNTNPVTDNISLPISGDWVESWAMEEYGQGTLAGSNGNFVYRSGTGNGLGPGVQPGGLFDYASATSGTVSNTYTFTLSGTGAFRSMPTTMTAISPLSTAATAPNLVPEAANLVAWWSADCYTFSSGCTTPSAGTLSTAWYDRSGNSRALTVHGTCTFTTNALNSQPVVTFDGTSCYLQNALSISATNGRTMIIVFAQNATPGGRLYSGSNSSSWALGTVCSTAIAGVLQEAVAFKVVPSGTTCDTNYHIVTAETQNSPWLVEIRTDRVQRALGTNTAYTFGTTENSPTLGWTSPQFFKGSMAEVIYFNTNISQSSVRQIENYLHNKYGI